MDKHCPRDGTLLHTETERGIQIDRCSQCKGAWYDYDELAQLEATVAPDADERSGTIEYSKRDDGLPCPACKQPMEAFDYRAYSLELDACSQGHGWWLDAGESERVREIMRERVSGLQRSAVAEQAWSRAKAGDGGVIGQIKHFLTGKR